MNPQPLVIYRAAAVRDARGADFRPGAVAVRGRRIVAVGHPDDLTGHRGEHPTFIDLPRTLLLPALVNAHAHLDLTDVGPWPYPGSFVEWVAMVVRQASRDPQAVAASVQHGLVMSEQAGVGFIGSIARSADSVRARQHPTGVPAVPGVSYLECIGLGDRQRDAIARLEHDIKQLDFEAPAPGSVRGSVLGIQPHAPYSTGPEVYAAAVRLSQDRAMRLSTHLAETPEEIEFVRDASGPLKELLKDMGRDVGAVEPTGLHPIEWLQPYLRRGRWLLAHCNYVDDHQISLLDKARASVAYCPVASDYFGHHDPQAGRAHRYRDMLDAGVNVCLGTDSIICQPPDEPQPLGMLAPMRHLYRRDKTDPNTLLAMATVNGLVGLAIDETLAMLRPGSPAQFTAVDIDPHDPTDPLVQALLSRGPSRGMRADAPGAHIP